jgi:hypothetical protein
MSDSADSQGFDEQQAQPNGPAEHHPVGGDSAVVPAQQASMPAYALTIGDIGITSSAPPLLVTPNGYAELRGSQWMFFDRSTTETKIPTWAIVCAIIFAFACLLGLLLLLVKEPVTSGYVEVSVRNGQLVHTTQIPVSSPAAVNLIRSQVQQAQALTSQA